MHKTLLGIGVLAAALLAVGTAGIAIGDDDDHHRGHDDDDHHAEYHDDDHDGWIEPDEDVEPVRNATYAEECGACHMAYQPGLLRSDGWQRIMDTQGLLDHFGDDASLSAPVRGEIAGYLAANAAETAGKSRSRAFSVGNADAGGLPRISATRYFRNEHHEIPARLVTGNPDVGSWSNCNACHQGADEGVYNEHRVRIPGHGRWDD